MDQGGPTLVRDHPELIDPAPLWQALQDRRLLLTMAMLVIVNLGMAYGIGGLNEPGALAWEAHLGGFALGLLAFTLFDKSRRPASGRDPII
jgi:membrane associated rhomboid family serine protease